MHNLLIDDLPNSIEIDDVQYEINADFRNVLTVAIILDDDVFTYQERVQMALHKFYIDVPKNEKQAILEIYSFINCYRNSEDDIKHEPYYDFDEDSSMIFSAFMQVYGLDLTNTNLKMHWFKFISLFENLNDGTPMFVRVVNIRSEKVDVKSSQEYRNNLNMLKQKFQLTRNKKLLERLTKKRKVRYNNVEL